MLAQLLAFQMAGGGARIAAAGLSALTLPASLPHLVLRAAPMPVPL